MLQTELPNLSNITYGRAEYLKREIEMFVTYAEKHPTSSAAAFETWWTAATATVATKLAAASP